MLHGFGGLARSFSQASVKQAAAGQFLLRSSVLARFNMSTSALTDLLGDRVQSHDGDLSTPDISSDYVGLYFSASWCGPCRRWTPKLINFYKEFTAHHQGKLEVVLVSSDRNEKDAKQYFADMPWKMLPYEEQDRRTQLASMFKVRRRFVCAARATIPCIAIN